LAVDVLDDDADRLFHSRVLRRTNSEIDVSDGRDSADALSLPKYVVLIMGKHRATSRHHFIGSPDFTPHGFGREQQQNAGAHNARFHWITVSLDLGKNNAPTGATALVRGSFVMV
jgi:hypothetical protein